MTQKRSWLALGALLAAIIGGTVWAAEQEKKTTTDCCAEKGCCAAKCAAKDKACCADQCCTKEKEKTCCEGKCCTKDKGCCADGKCCGCCGKAPQTATLPVPPGSAIQVMIAPPGAFPEAGYAPDWAGPAPVMPPVPAPAYQPAPPAQAVPLPPLGQYVSYPCPAPPPPPLPCGAMVGGRHSLSPWRLSVVTTNNRTCVAMRWDGDEDTCALCEDMVLKIGQERLKVSVEDKQVHVCGTSVKGSADTITRNAADGSLLLQGHVKMHYGKQGQKVEVVAEHVSVGVADGRIEVKGLGSAAARPGPSAGTSPTSTAPARCPACPGSAGDCQHVFNFWTGFFH